jgi:hypothetical protein
MYKLYPSLVLGFHACDESVGERVLSGAAPLRPSENEYDWLGHGIYFWENSPNRATQWGELQQRRAKVAKPCVVGAVIALGRCFDLLESESLEILRKHYEALVETYRSAGIEHQIPKNEGIRGSEDLLLRKLDCAVIEYMHSQMEEHFKLGGNVRPFDSVRGAFWEGEELYPGAGFKQKNHVQICVRNPNCIKGYFRPLDSTGAHPLV